MIVGFTGTRYGMSEGQLAGVLRWLTYNPPERGHHGCCVGGDAQFHHLLRKMGIPIEGWPPLKGEWRATDLEGFDILHDPQSYMDRNWDIVIHSDVVLAAPHTEHEVFRGSGTWSTIRRARNMFDVQGIPKLIIFPPNYTV